MVLIHFKHGLLLRIILCGRLRTLDSWTHMSSRVSSKCMPNFCYLQNEPILRKFLSDSSRVRRLSDSQTHMSSRVSSKCMPNFCYLQNEPILRNFLSDSSWVRDSRTHRLIFLLGCHQNARPTFITSIMNHT
jgi:hypothetical protein